MHRAPPQTTLQFQRQPLVNLVPPRAFALRSLDGYVKAPFTTKSGLYAVAAKVLVLLQLCFANVLAQKFGGRLVDTDGLECHTQ